MEYIRGKGIQQNSYKVARKSQAEQDGGKQKQAVKRLLGVVLLVLAGLFGEVIIAVPTSVAFGVIFLYISLQLWVWIDLPEKKNEKN